MINDRQKFFCEEYILDCDATKAAIRAKYSPKTASAIASRLMKNKEIKEYINSLKQDHSQELKFCAKEVLEKLVLLSRANISKFLKRDASGKGYSFEIPSDVTADDLYPISEVITKTYYEGKGDDKKQVTETKIKLESRLKSLELAGKHVVVQAFKENNLIDDSVKFQSLAEKILSGDKK